MDTALRDELFQVLAAKGAKLMGVGDLSGIVDGEPAGTGVPRPSEYDNCRPNGRELADSPST